MELINKIILRTDSIFSLCIDHYFLFFIFDHRKVSIETFFKRSFTYTRIRERFARRKKREETRALFSLSLFLSLFLSLWIRSPIADPFSTRWVLGKPWTTVPFLRKPATPSYVRLCQGERAAISVDRPPRCNYRYTAGCADTGGPFCNDHNRSIGLSIFPPSTRFFCRWKRLRNPYATFRAEKREREREREENLGSTAPGGVFVPDSIRFNQCKIQCKIFHNKRKISLILWNLRLIRSFLSTIIFFFLRLIGFKEDEEDYFSLKRILLVLPRTRELIERYT